MIISTCELRLGSLWWCSRADCSNSNNQYNQQQQMGYPLVDIGYGQQQQLQPQYTSYNVSLNFSGA